MKLVVNDGCGSFVVDRVEQLQTAAQWLQTAAQWLQTAAQRFLTGVEM
ncbi:MAG: hypothetical protein AB4352_18590 [Hormoscilla sp.]